jgi:polar amino acid transport system substrate-binding protein
MKRLLTLVFVLTIAFTFALTGCGGDSKTDDAAGTDAPAADGKVAAIQAAGELVMYTNAEFPPYEYLGDNDEIIGVDIEIGKAIAAKLGVELVIENAVFDGIVASIASGKGDVAITGLTIDEGRKKEIDFSTPYVDSIQYIVVPEDSTLATFEDLADKSVGSQTGTTGQMFLDDEISDGVLAGTDTVDNPYNSAPIAMEDLKAGRLDAVIIDEQVAIQLANQNDGYKAIALNFANGTPVTEQYGVGIAKGNEDLLAIINEVIDEILAQDKITTWIEQYSIADEK